MPELPILLNIAVNGIAFSMILFLLAVGFTHGEHFDNGSDAWDRLIYLEEDSNGYT